MLFLWLSDPSRSEQSKGVVEQSTVEYKIDVNEEHKFSACQTV